MPSPDSGSDSGDGGDAMDRIRAAHPRFSEAVIADARLSAAFRGERFEFRGRLDALGQVLRLTWQSDAFLAQVLYRAKAALQRRGVPILPRLAHRLAMMSAQVCIGDPVVIQPGIYLPHGQVVIDGVTLIEAGVTVRPWVTIGLADGILQGPHLASGAQIGTGAKIFGPVTIGTNARIGANAVVRSDVPPGTRAVGVPARIVVRDS